MFGTFFSKKTIIMLLFVFLWWIAGLRIVRAGENLAGMDYLPTEVIVKFKPQTTEAAIGKLNAQHGTTTIYTNPVAGFRRLNTSTSKEKTVPDLVELYKNDPNVEYAEPNYIAQAFWIPNDTYYPYQWHLNNSLYGGINIEKAWDMERGGQSGIVIAVIDTGVAYEDYADQSGKYYQSPDLILTRFTPGYDFVNKDTHPNDDLGHGTHVTGTIAQNTDNRTGTAGIAFNCSIMPIKVLGKDGLGTYADIAEGIIYAADNGADVINLSLGGSSDSQTLKNAVAYAFKKGVTIVCAAGNDGSANKIAYPAAYDDYCIAVGATRYDETIAPYSNKGNSLDLVAPGGDLNVDQNKDSYPDGVLQQTFKDTTNNWAYRFYQGTSMAAPHVAGTAALLISRGIAATPIEVRNVLQATAEDKGTTGWDPKYGYGIVDAHAALSYNTIDDPNVPAENHPPQAIEQSAGTKKNTAINITLTANDPDGDTLTYNIESIPMYGLLSYISKDTVTYTPNTDYTGKDSFTFTASDGTVTSNTATVKITITQDTAITNPPVSSPTKRNSFLGNPKPTTSQPTTSVRNILKNIRFPFASTLPQSSISNKSRTITPTLFPQLNNNPSQTKDSSLTITNSIEDTANLSSKTTASNTGLFNSSLLESLFRAPSSFGKLRTSLERSRTDSRSTNVISTAKQGLSSLNLRSGNLPRTRLFDQGLGNLSTFISGNLRH